MTLIVRFYKRKGFHIEGVIIETPHNDKDEAIKYATAKLIKHPGYKKGWKVDKSYIKNQLKTTYIKPDGKVARPLSLSCLT